MSLNPKRSRRLKALACVLAMLTSLVVVAARPGAAQDMTIAELATSNADLSTLVTALTVATDAGRVDFLAAVSDPAEDLTVFAPTNAAFAALGPALDDVLADPSGALTDVLLYHVVGESLNGAELLAAGSATTLLGQDVAIGVANGRITVNNAQIVVASVPASNGVVHVIDAVLLPSAAPAPPAPAPTQSIAEIAVATPELSTLVTALTVATDAGRVDFLGAVSDPGADLTVFAPTDAAFAALGAALNDVLADPSGALTDVLLYHVLGSSESGADLAAAGSATTLLGTDVAVEVRGGDVFINDSQVVIADVQATNGIVHVIDAVLLPSAAPAPPAPPAPAPTPTQSIAEIAVATPELSTLVTALTVATDAGRVDFLGAVSNPGADLTVFAPTNDAFAALGGALNDVLADPDGALTDVLLYHVLGSSESGADLVAAGSATTLLGADVVIELRGGDVFINNSQVVIADIEATNGIVHVIDAVLLPAPAGGATGGATGSGFGDGDVIYLKNANTNRYLDADFNGHEYNVDTSSTPRADDEWQLEAIGNGNYRLRNVKYDRYLDADPRSRHYNVDLGGASNFGAEWEIIPLANGRNLLRTVDFNRYLDGDRYNVDTSSTPKLDDEWEFIAVP